MKHDICFSPTEGMIQEPRFHGQIFCTSSIQILKPKIKMWVYYLTWIDYHRWKSPSLIFCPEAKAASWFAKWHPKQFNNNKSPIKVITHFPLYLEFINAYCQRFVTHFEISLEKIKLSCLIVLLKEQVKYPSNINSSIFNSKGRHIGEEIDTFFFAQICASSSESSNKHKLNCIQTCWVFILPKGLTCLTCYCHITNFQNLIYNPFPPNENSIVVFFTYCKGKSESQRIKTYSELNEPIISPRRKY